MITAAVGLEARQDLHALASYLQVPLFCDVAMIRTQAAVRAKGTLVDVLQTLNCKSLIWMMRFKAS